MMKSLEELKEKIAISWRSAREGEEDCEEFVSLLNFVSSLERPLEEEFMLVNLDRIFDMRGGFEMR